MKRNDAKKNKCVKTVLQQASLEYRALYFKKYGIRLADIEAAKQATDFINLFRVLLKSPLTQDY